MYPASANPPTSATASVIFAIPFIFIVSSKFLEFRQNARGRSHYCGASASFLSHP
jgi:hypothetical protein